MLFKVVDYNNKFIQYASVCISQADLENVVLFSSNTSAKLRGIKSGLFKLIINCSFNQYTYKYAPIKIECYVENTFNPYYLDEILSPKRASEIAAKLNHSSKKATWVYAPYVPATTTGTTLTGNTIMLGDGYHVGGNQNIR